MAVTPSTPVAQGPINRIIGVQWRNGAVEFPGGTGATDCIQCNASLVANSSLVSLSGWFVPPVGGAAYSLFDMTPNDAAAQDFFLKYSNGGFIFGSSLSFSNPGAEWRAGGSTATGFVPAGEWCHVLLAVDAGHRDGDPKIGKCYINGINAMESTTPPAGDDDPGQASGSERSYEFAFSGSPVGVPDIVSNISDAPLIACAHVQVWVGKFIDPDIVGTLDNFIRVIDGTVKTAKPASLNLAETAYGVPDFRFRGGKSAFPNNTGSGGAFAVHGTIDNYSPEPSYLVA